MGAANGAQSPEVSEVGSPSVAGSRGGGSVSASGATEDACSATEGVTAVLPALSSSLEAVSDELLVQYK